MIPKKKSNRSGNADKRATVNLAAPRLKISQDAQMAIDKLLSMAHLHLRPLSEEEFRRYSSRGYIWGAEYSGFDTRIFKYRVFVLVDRNYPFSLPSIFIDPPMTHMQFPHAEEGGKLCLYPSGTSAKLPDEPEVEFHKLIVDFEALMRNYADPTWCEREFEKEFATYWTFRANTGIQSHSLLPPDQASGVVRVYKTSHPMTIGNKTRHVPFLVFGTDDKEIENWYQNLYGKKCDQAGFGPAFHVKAGKPPSPPNYPLKNIAFIDLEGFQEEATISSFCKTFARLPDEILFVVTYQTASGAVPTLQKLLKGPISGRHPHGGDSKLRKDLQHGNCEMGLLIDRYFSWPAQTDILRGVIHRVDTAWVHGRDQNQQAVTLREKKVVMVGVGSIGSEVLSLLGKSGVGETILIDPKNLTWPNTSRHILGAKFTRLNKATTAKWLQETNYPHLGPHQAYAEKWEDVYASNPEIFKNADLIINTTGSFDTGGSFVAFNRIARRDRLPPVLYGWSEAYALAGHATILDHTTGCVECGFQNGSFLHPVVAWEEGAPFREAAGCETAFQPYGAIEMANVTNMIAKEAVAFLLGKSRVGQHRAWVGDLTEIRQMGGRPNPEFFERNPKGSAYISGGWVKSPTCSVCGNPEAEKHEVFAAK
jgi:sulfur-carrier protein adenylyltransferase/sulfurtransferase